jgi:hypothetical protein
MANPSLTKSGLVILGKHVSGSVTTTLSSILANSASSNKVFKINSIYAANISTGTDTWISVAINDGSNDRYLAHEIYVPTSSTQIILDKDSYLYLLEGHSVKVQAGNSAILEVTIGYEEIY